MSNIAKCKFNRFEKKYKRSYAEQLNDLQKAAIALMVEQLILERKASSTQKTYKYHLAELFVFYKDLKPEEITKKQLIHFLLHKIRFKKNSRIHPKSNYQCGKGILGTGLKKR